MIKDVSFIIIFFKNMAFGALHIMEENVVGKEIEVKTGIMHLHRQAN